MRNRLSPLGFALILVGLSLAASASAAPVVTYPELDPSGANSMTVVQVTGSPTCPQFGAGNCLTNGPLAINSASVTLDLGTNELQNLSLLVVGPGNIDLAGYNGYERIVFHDAAFQSTGTTVIGGGGSFAIAGAVTASSLELFLAGNLSAIPDIVVLNYTTAPNPNFAAGTIGIAGDQLTVSVTGLDLGSFPDPVTGALASVKADFSFVATVPEPSAALLYGIGLLIAGPALRRRAAH
jgi:hypothetical protein